MEIYETLVKKIHKHCPELQGKHRFAVGYQRCTYCSEPRILVEKIRTNVIRDEKSGGETATVTVKEYNQVDFPCSKAPSTTIQLQHVLRAIREVQIGKYTWEISFHWENSQMIFGNNAVSYDLSKPFSEQSAELYKWLNEVIQ